MMEVALPGFPRPVPRWRELGLLASVAGALLLGGLSLGTTRTGSLAVAHPAGLATYLGALAAVHVVLVLAGRRLDEVLLPTVGMLGGLGLLLAERLPQDLVVQRVGSATLGLASLQLIWLVLALAIAGAVAVTVRSDRWLRLYKYSWAALGLGLLLLTFVFGRDVNGSILTLDLGPVSWQPSELLKVILVVFFAGYLAENRVLLADARVRVAGRLTLPPAPYLLPAALMLALALGIVVIQRDLGAALLFFSVFLCLFYLASGSKVDVLLGIALFLLGFAVLALVFPTVRDRVAIWLDPWAEPARDRLPDHPGSACVCERRAAGDRPGGRPPISRGATADPRRPHGLPARGTWRRARHDGRDRDSRLLHGARGPRAPHRGRSGGRRSGAARRRPGARHRRAGRDHRRRQPEAHPVDRHHASLHQLRRVLAGRQRVGGGALAGVLGSGSRAAGGAASSASARARPDVTPGGPARRGQRPLGGRVVRLGIALAIAFGGVALGAGYWQVLRADDLSHDPADAGVIAAARSTVRGRILDRDGRVLATNRRDASGDLYRVYADRSLSAPLGYASSLYGSAGLEAADTSVLMGLGADDPLSRALAKFRSPVPRGDDLRTSLSLTLQRLAVRLLGADRGAVVALDPRTGDVLALASTPTFDASGIADPDHRPCRVLGRARRSRPAAPRPGHPGALRPRLGVQDRDSDRRLLVGRHQRRHGVPPAAGG